jgi:hypothetical protein
VDAGVEPPLNKGAFCKSVKTFVREAPKDFRSLIGKRLDVERKDGGKTNASRLTPPPFQLCQIVGTTSDIWLSCELEGGTHGGIRTCDWVSDTIRECLDDWDWMSFPKSGVLLTASKSAVRFTLSAQTSDKPKRGAGEGCALLVTPL